VILSGVALVQSSGPKVVAVTPAAAEGAQEAA
jgi:hypothetical protein